MGAEGNKREVANMLYLGRYCRVLMFLILTYVWYGELEQIKHENFFKRHHFQICTWAAALRSQRFLMYVCVHTYFSRGVPDHARAV